MYRNLLFLIMLILFSFNSGMASEFPFFLARGKVNPITSLSREENCEYYERSKNSFLLDPSCILYGQIPRFSLQDEVDAVWDSVSSIGTGYLSQKKLAVYGSEQAKIAPQESLYPLSEQRRTQLMNAKLKGEKVELPISLFAQELISDLAFFVSEKDISTLKPCTKFNYLLAFKNLDGKGIKAGATFNVNRYLSGLRGYCEGLGATDFKFYGGVCGVASQLFRASLTSPLLQVPVRWGHNDRFSAYYGEKVQGDDAAVYETSKQLLIKNISPTDLLIKTFQQGENTFLVFAWSKKAVAGQWVKIRKNYQEPFQVELIKEIYPKNQKSDFLPRMRTLFPRYSWEEVIQPLATEIFTSHYSSINSESR